MTERDALRDRVEHAVGALFEIEDEIGRGGMAVVYRARDVRLRRKVALKVLPPELAFRADVKSRFLREAQMSAQLSHPNIVPIYTVDELDGVVFFAMGLVEGETLAQRLAHDPRPDLTFVRSLLREVADALAYAHARSVVHRDVKPDNILVDGLSGRALVSDFGIARAAEGDSRLTVTGVAVGTPAYMSPEQAMGEREVDGRADIYSLGIVGYQMLAGELPFTASNTPSMLMKHISERPRPLSEVRPDLPSNLTYAIERAMAKGRDERWPTATAFRDALADVAPPPPLTPPSRRSVPLPEPEVQLPVVADAGLPAYPHFPALPPGWMFNRQTREYGREALREWKEEQRRWRERYGRDRSAVARAGRRELRRAAREAWLPQTPEDRIRRIQRMAMGYATTIAFLGTINFLTVPRFPWVLFAAMGMGVGLIARIARAWSDGIPFHRFFQRQPVSAPQDPQSVAMAPPYAQPNLSAHTAVSNANADAIALAAIPRDVLDGPHGPTIREAIATKRIIADVLGKLSAPDRQMLPEIQPTVDALVERVTSLAQALHQLDSDASPAAIATLDRRLADAKAGPADAPDLERRLQLLERQQATLKDLAARRGAVADQLDRASLVLQTMKLDLFKLRSSGLDAKLDATTGATQEARALSTDIGRVLDAANEVRKL